MDEDFDNHRRIFDAAMIFKLPPQFGQCSMSMSKTRLSSLAQQALHEFQRRHDDWVVPSLNALFSCNTT